MGELLEGNFLEKQENLLDLERLSNGKDGSFLLNDLVGRYGDEIVNKYRRNSKTPKEIQEILEQY